MRPASHLSPVSGTLTCQWVYCALGAPHTTPAAQPGDYVKKKGRIARVRSRLEHGNQVTLMLDYLSPSSSPGVGRVCPICNHDEGCDHEITSEPAP